MNDWTRLIRGGKTNSQGRDSGVEGFPLRSWSIEIYLLNEHGEEVPATLFDKVIYRLHPSFGERANQSELFLPFFFLFYKRVADVNDFTFKKKKR